MNDKSWTAPAILIVIVLNIIFVFYQGGKITQKVDDVSYDVVELKHDVKNLQTEVRNK